MKLQQSLYSRVGEVAAPREVKAHPNPEALVMRHVRNGIKASPGRVRAHVPRGAARWAAAAVLAVALLHPRPAAAQGAATLTYDRLPAVVLRDSLRRLSERRASQRAAAARVASRPATAPRRATPVPVKAPREATAPVQAAASSASVKTAPAAPATSAPAAPATAAAVTLAGAPVAPKADSIPNSAPAPKRDSAAAPAPKRDSAAAPAAPAAAPAAAAARPPVPTVAVSVGKMSIGGLLQVWASAGSGDYTSTYRLRRAEMKLTGEVTPRARWTMVVDAAKGLSVSSSSSRVDSVNIATQTSVNQASRMLQDAFITLAYLPHTRLDVGQQKVPLGFVGSQSSGALETVERPLFSSDRARGGSFGDVRDIGAQAHVDIGSRMELHAGLFNGSGESQNDTDRNGGKATVARVLVRPPFVGGLQLGASGAWSGTPATDQPRRDRLGAEAQLKSGPVTLRSELMTGKDGDVARRGAYGHLGVRVRPPLELVASVDTWDPDIRLESTTASASERDFLAGATWFLEGSNAKAQLNLVRKTFGNDLLPSRTLVLLNLQTSW